MFDVWQGEDSQEKKKPKPIVDIFGKCKVRDQKILYTLYHILK